MVVTGLAGSTALKAITDATTMAEKDCLLVPAELDVFASFDLMWFGFKCCNSHQEINKNIIQEYNFLTFQFVVKF